MTDSVVFSLIAAIVASLVVAACAFAMISDPHPTYGQCANARHGMFGGTNNVTVSPQCALLLRNAEKVKR